MRLPEGKEPAAVAPEKLAVQVARRIVDEIIERQWPIGEVLGSETALREHFGVSRSILREAIRVLEHSRVVQMRQGPGGGLVVGTPDPTPAIRGVVIYLEYAGATVEQVVHARFVFERMAIAAVSESLTESGVQELRSSASGEDGRLPENFHIALGRLSGNPVLELYIDILVRLTAAYTHRARGIAGNTEEEGCAAARQHLAIAESIVAGASSRAQSDLVTHLDRAATWLSGLVHPQPGESTAIGPMDLDPDEWPRERKLAGSVAGRIRDDIVSEGRYVGEVLGSEADFVSRYGVSRSVFRESIRILEHYSVARMRRGPGGGLVVLEPDPTSSIRTIALYLDFRGVTVEHLRAVREEVELGCLTAAMRSGMLDKAELWGDRQRRDSKAGRCSTCLRDRVATLSGDPVLMLFRSVLATLWDEYGTGRRPSDPCRSTDQTPDDRAELDAIVDAMVAGDEGLAQFRMRRHLREHPGW
ncbi:GntR family transcriptional regulator [Rhodococcus sp. ACS1]|uniref:FadR/GntR family transcriptional regulator n=1 Tax=Rhodococcus sp. ACS1 TaxID=2028570 RepID=UPI000BB0DD38|nr:GntR family transcriptional regulator [Rhodococcus sp. ACS1]PBC47951.1 GntR family transcriptional regulator [Rhodococcus sp. ACS1]